MLDPVVTITGSLFAGLLLIVSALHKIRHLDDFRRAVEGYEVLPRPLVIVPVLTLPLVEAVAGIGLLVPVTSAYAGMLAAGVFLAYGLLISVSLYRGKQEIDCGCHFGQRESRLSLWMVPRNIALALVALLPVMPTTARGFYLADFINIAGGVLFLGLMYMCLEELLSNRSHYVNYILKKEQLHG
ncbi:MauE/DoxX family redox-associated membrane protein [Emcibacter sp.]|uniref:MauE/DoxX family redox-associated membrane protein n=1 Tax=Emcibacter sp. TaxID=1979954 RepID=UPI002AA7777F|nr:MauE/DoxX family redox-associated membrane protein [Emcibacter sp.]